MVLSSSPVFCLYDSSVKLAKLCGFRRGAEKSLIQYPGKPKAKSDRGFLAHV